MTSVLLMGDAPVFCQHGGLWLLLGLIFVSEERDADEKTKFKIRTAPSVCPQICAPWKQLRFGSQDTDLHRHTSPASAITRRRRRLKCATGMCLMTGNAHSVPSIVAGTPYNA